MAYEKKTVQEYIAETDDNTVEGFDDNQETRIDNAFTGIESELVTNKVEVGAGGITSAGAISSKGLNITGYLEYVPTNSYDNKNIDLRSISQSYTGSTFLVVITGTDGGSNGLVVGLYTRRVIESFFEINKSLGLGTFSYSGGVITLTGSEFYSTRVSMLVI